MLSIWTNLKLCHLITSKHQNKLNPQAALRGGPRTCCLVFDLYCFPFMSVEERERGREEKREREKREIERQRERERGEREASICSLFVYLM